MTFLVALVLGVLLWRVHRRARADREKVDLLFGEVDRLTNRVTQLEEAFLAQRRRVSAPAPSPEPIPEPRPQPVERAQTFAPNVKVETAVPPEISPEPIESNIPQEVSGSWESLIGGNLLNKLGGFLLVIGIALLLSYSFANMGPAGRVAVSLLLSGALLGAGIWMERRESYRLFSWGLLGAGWAGLYITAYAMYALDAARVIENRSLGALLQLAVAMAMVGHSLRYRVQSITAVAATCAFGAMALAESSALAVGGLIPLSIALLYVAHRMRWHAIALLSLLSAYGIVILRGDPNSTLLSSQIFVAVHWLMFEVFDLALLRKEEDRPVYASFVFPANALLFVLLSYAKWNSTAPEQVWLFLAVAAGLFVVDAIVRERRRPDSYREPIVIASVLAALSGIRKADAAWTPAIVGVEAQLLILAGLRWRRPFLEALGGGAFLTSLCLLLVAIGGPETIQIGPTVWRAWTPAALLLAVFAYVNHELRTISIPYRSAGSALVMLVIGVEAPNRWRGLILTLWALVQVDAGIRRAAIDFLLQAMAAWVLSIVALGIGPLDSLTHQPSWDQWFVLCTASLANYILSFRMEPQETGLLAKFGGGRLAAVAFCAWATILAFSASWALVPDQWVTPAWMAIAVAIVLAGRRFGREAYTITGHSAAAVAAGRAVLFIASSDSSAATLGWRILSSGLVMAGSCLLWRFEKTRSTPWSQLHLGLAAVVLTVFLTIEISGTAITVAWGLEGLVLLACGLLIRERLLRLSGLGLFAACILKLFFYDLRTLDTIPRILSFIVLGLILLCVSWIYTKFRQRITDLF